MNNQAVDFNDPDQVLAEAERAGVDLAGLKRNLELSPDERLDQFLKAWAWLEWAKDARCPTAGRTACPGCVAVACGLPEER